MGANTFEDYGWGKTAKEAFRKAVEEARYENGHGGYTGTLAEKSEFVMIDVPPQWKGREEDYAYHLINKDDSRISDKWGPAGCILLESAETTEHVPYATTVSKYNQVGTRKWVTKYTVTSLGGGASRSFDSQTEAEKFAKDWVKSNNQSVTIKIEKKLVNGDQTIMRIDPKTKEVKSSKTMNKYIFFGWASS